MTLDSLQSARRAVAALIDGGVRDAVLAPGSRSAPLAYAFAAAEAAGAVRLHVRIDERVAGFTALGLTLATGLPVPIVTTSGTAVGELLPAVMEASHAGVPLIVLSADRPEDLRGTGANQTTDQAGLFSLHVRFEADVEYGADPVEPVRWALAAAAGNRVPRAAAGSHAHDGGPVTGPAGLASLAGPVQVNLAFRDPLAPAAGDAAIPFETLPAPPKPRWGQEPQGSGTITPGPGSTVAAADSSAAAGTPAVHPAAVVGTRPRTAVVIAGHGAGDVAQTFARAHGLPLLAEPSSNARYGPNALGPYRLLLNGFADRIEQAIVFGRPTLSRPVAALLASPDVERLLYEPLPAPWHEPGRGPGREVDSLAELSAAVAPGPDGWLAHWRDASDAAEAAIRLVLADTGELTGLHVADAVWDATDGVLVLGSSNPIRDVDLVAGTDWHPLDVYANRGLAGIDGTISTAVGIALGGGMPTRLLVGDLTFLHDVGALLPAVGEREPDLQVVVMNDGGGGIFSLLEHGALGEDPAWTGVVDRLFGTPQQADIAALAAGYGWAYARAEDAAGLDEILGRPIRGRSIVEVRTNRAGLRELHARIRVEVDRYMRL